MANVKVDVNLGGAPTALNRMAQLQGYKTGLLAGGTYLKGRVAVYPPERHGEQPFVSLKQQRAFFAKLKRGEIDVPYKRGISPGSQKLGQSWNVSASSNGLAVTVGTAAGYAKLVQGEQQTGYHKATGWKTAEDVAAQDGPQAVAIVEMNVQRMTDGKS